jgi:hypothetical protein
MLTNVLVPGPWSLQSTDPDLARRIAIVPGPMPDHCWQRQGGKGDGYGFVRLNSSLQRVHRRIWKDLVGPLPSSIPLDHLRINRACCNPAHLQPVSTALNNRRGRRARLDDNKVQWIRYTASNNLVGPGPYPVTQSQLATKFGESAATIRRVISGKQWA